MTRRLVVYNIGREDAVQTKMDRKKNWLSSGTARITLTPILVALLSLTLACPINLGHASSATQTYMPVCAPINNQDPLQGMKLPRERNRKSLNQIYEFDHFPLGNRIPVIIIPGRAEEFQHDAWWKRFHDVTTKNPTFEHNYKLYVFLYDSNEELDAQANSLAADLKKRFGCLSKSQPLMLVAYSLGGVMARVVLEDSNLLNQVDTLFAISVPFHGSPIFEPAWFSDFLNTPTRSPIRRFWDRTFYRAYMFDKSNLTRGMGWDNFDGSKPQFHIDRTPHVIGDQVNGMIPTFQEYCNADEIRAKTIVYASYLENAFTQTTGNNDLLPWYVKAKPVSFLSAVLPLYGFTVHSVFRYTNYQLANLATYTTEDPQGKNTNLYRYNDGAIPVSSMLFLSPSAEPYAGDIQDLTQQATVKKIRILFNIDHVDMGEYNVRKKNLIRSDMMHPQDTPRSPNQWIIDDLNARCSQISAQPLPITSTEAP